MSNTNESEKSRSKLYDMVVRGKNFRETIDFEMFGEEVDVILRPLVDAEFLPITALMQEILDIDEEEAVEQIREAKEEAEEENGEPIATSACFMDGDSDRGRAAVADTTLPAKAVLVGGDVVTAVNTSSHVSGFVVRKS